MVHIHPPPSTITTMSAVAPNAPALNQPSEQHGEATAAPRTAPAPFDKHSADACVTLRTADQVDFHVCKTYLAAVSSCFANMFQDAHPDDAPGGAKEPLPVSETSSVLERLLRTFCPPPNVKFSTLEEIAPVIAAADKYQMDAVVASLQDILLEKFVDVEPLRVFAIATKYMRRGSETGSAADRAWKEIKKAAIRAFLTVSSATADAHADELDELTAREYHHILSYRRTYTKKLRLLLRGLDWLQEGGWTFVCCGGTCARVSEGYMLKGGTSPRQPVQWFWKHYGRVAEDLEDWPSSKVLKDAFLCEPAWREASRCIACRDLVYDHLKRFMAVLEIEVDRLVDEVSQTIV
ncbi:hypothetical protein C8Q76DRAFT_793113 [Earliella scabrosa]|nr:hypothetical protein C8Q76DRAFT_793113 [Earliella scabrosa]